MTEQPVATDPTTDLWSLVATHADRLAGAGVDSPLHDASLLAQHALGLSAAQLRTAPLPAPADAARLEALVARRAAREPLQLVLATAWFRYLRLTCRAGVFVPRPETEIVAGLAITAARAAGAHPVVVEPCPGTGAIALAVTAEVPGAQVVATDVDPAAVALARHNLSELTRGRADVPGPAADASCTVLQGDLLAPVDPALRGRVDVLVANPPYLPVGDGGELPPEVADHDPATALFGGDDGLTVIRRLIGAARHWLRPAGTLVLELDPRCADAASQHAAAAGLEDVRIERDLTGTDRILVARTPDGRVAR